MPKFVYKLWLIRNILTLVKHVSKVDLRIIRQGLFLTVLERGRLNDILSCLFFFYFPQYWLQVACS